MHLDARTRRGCGGYTTTGSFVLWPSGRSGRSQADRGSKEGEIWKMRMVERGMMREWE